MPAQFPSDPTNPVGPPNDFFAGRESGPPPLENTFEGFLQKAEIDPPEDLVSEPVSQKQDDFLRAGLHFFDRLKKK